MSMACEFHMKRANSRSLSYIATLRPGDGCAGCAGIKYTKSRVCEKFPQAGPLHWTLLTRILEYSSSTPITNPNYQKIHLSSHVYVHAHTTDRSRRSECMGRSSPASKPSRINHVHTYRILEPTTATAAAPKVPTRAVQPPCTAHPATDRNPPLHRPHTRVPHESIIIHHLHVFQRLHHPVNVPPYHHLCRGRAHLHAQGGSGKPWDTARERLPHADICPDCHDRVRVVPRRRMGGCCRYHLRGVLSLVGRGRKATFPQSAVWESCAVLRGWLCDIGDRCYGVHSGVVFEGEEGGT